MYYIGIDVSTKESALCILDGKGKIERETKLPTDPESIARFIAATGLAIERIGLESGGKSRRSCESTAVSSPATSAPARYRR